MALGSFPGVNINLEDYIRSVKDFPVKGVDFKDITPLLNNSKAYNYSIDKLLELYQDESVEKIGSFDARGFLFGPAMALRLDVPFFPFRKAGKLPYKTIGQDFALEYGKNTVEIHTDAIKKGENVLLVDDVLATGGTLEAGCKLVEKLQGNIIGCALLIELSFLDGRKKLKNYDVKSVLQYR